ncbi:MAG: hypothetical protein EA355_01990, partial [Rhodobacteraceae bacterium]
MQTAGFGAAGVALVVAVAIFATGWSTRQTMPKIDAALVQTVAESQGFVAPAAAAALRERVARTQAELEEIRRTHPEWRREIDAAIDAFNRSDLDGARDAFARIDALIDARREELRREAARSKHAQATLFHPFEASKAGPLLCDAATLARNNLWYWIDCGDARQDTGRLAAARDAYERAHALAEEAGEARDRA